MIEYLLIVDFCEKTLYEKNFKGKKLKTSKNYLLELSKNYLLTSESNFVKKIDDHFYFFYRSKNSNFFILSSKIKNTYYFEIILQSEQFSETLNYNFHNLDKFIKEKNKENKLKKIFQKKNEKNFLEISNISEAKTNQFSEDLELERDMLEIINSNENFNPENKTEKENLNNKIGNENIKNLSIAYSGLVFLIFFNIFLFYKNLI